MEELPIRRFEDDGRQLVNARDLHEYLGVQTRYNDWFKSRVEKYGFIEGEDFVCFTETSVKGVGGRPATYHGMTVGMAKEMGMIENTPEGKKVRQYFILKEREASQAREMEKPQSRLDIMRSTLAAATLALDEIEATKQEVSLIKEDVEELKAKGITTERFGGGKTVGQVCALSAYRIADAMMEARKETMPKTAPPKERSQRLK